MVKSGTCPRGIILRMAYVGRERENIPADQ
jgi:hypothetical protein